MLMLCDNEIEQVTIFGESAGAMLTNMVLLNASISNFARAAVRMWSFHTNGDSE